MSTPALFALAKATVAPYASFSEAVDSLLSALEPHFPSSSLVLARLDDEHNEYQVVEARGEGPPKIETGFTVGLAASMCLYAADDKGPTLCADAGAEPVYASLPMREALGIRAYAAVPLELSDGTRVASLAAFSATAGLYDENHLALLTVAARLLSFEWERIAREVELRRLKAAQRDDQTTDRATGVANRLTFLSQLEREWHLASRGTIDSYLVAVRLQSPDGATDFSDPRLELAVKNVAEVLKGTARRTDVVGRLSDDLFASVLVGCKGEAGAAAFAARLRSALARVNRDAPGRLELSLAARNLADAQRPEDLVLWASGRQPAEEPSGPALTPSE